MLVLAPYSAHPATIIAKIIPNTIIILSFLYIYLLSNLYLIRSFIWKHPKMPLKACLLAEANLLVDIYNLCKKSSYNC